MTQLHPIWPSMNANRVRRFMPSVSTPSTAVAARWTAALLATKTVKCTPGWLTGG